MNKKDLYVRRQYIGRRGAVPRRRSTPYAKDKRRRRELVPKWAKWGDQSHQGHKSTHYQGYDIMKDLRDGHTEEKKLNRNRKNFRRTQHAIKDKRKYWDKTGERKREGL